MANPAEGWHSCARCRGRFPGPGVERDGKLYCCDKCAAGPNPKMMLFRMAPMALMVLGAGALAGWLAGRRQ